MNTAEKAQVAAQEINAARTDAGWVYHDDSMRQHYLCESEEEMAYLYDLQHDEDDDIRGSAYSHWCAGTSHPECDEDGENTEGLVCGEQVQKDFSGGQGHCWRNVSAWEIGADTEEEIAAEIIDGKNANREDYVAGNGQHYRW